MIHYRGRFAPSPSGPMHFGSLVAALASCLDARSQAGTWLVRMEDLDRPREVPGAADAILRALEHYGFEWDGPVLYQSRRESAYAAALERLQSLGTVFPCACTRREIADSAIVMGEGAPRESVYPGTCRNGLPAGRSARATRVRAGDAVIAFEDRLQGRIEQNLAAEAGDFIVHRADSLYAYQLAVVVDDADQGITDVVRGADLLGSTPRQIHLQRLLGYPSPRYLHLPVAVNASGEKLSKQTRAHPIDLTSPGSTLVNGLLFLGQGPPSDLGSRPVSEIWRWARQHWDTGKIPRATALPAPTGTSEDSVAK